MVRSQQLCRESWRIPLVSHVIGTKQHVADSTGARNYLPTYLPTAAAAANEAHHGAELDSPLVIDPLS